MMPRQPTFADVEREAVALEFTVVVDGEWVYVEKPGTGESGMFCNDSYGLRVAYDQLQQKRVDLARADKILAAPGTRWRKPTARVHRHIWVRDVSTLWLSLCRDQRCLWCAVCPGCLGDGRLAMRVVEQMWGVVVWWCPAHQVDRSRFFGNEEVQ
ncbi:MAG: hypothetical protein WCD86_09025 [Ktedonobacteraceae bacterium]